MNRLFRNGPKMKKVLPSRVINGFAYNCHSQYKEDTLYIECRDKPNCPGRGKLVGNEDLTLTRAHNHAPQPLLEILYEFENALYDAVMADPFKSLRSIYDHISVHYPQASIHRTWSRMMDAMQKWRNILQPRIPNNFLEYINLLREPRWQHFIGDGEQQMHVAHIHINEETYLVVYTNLQLLRILACNEFYIDCTFKIIPHKPKSYQLLTILARVSDAVVPVYWVLMNRKTTEAYESAIRYFSQIAPHIQPNIFMADFESALSTALNNVYPGASVKHCYFHFTQAVVKRLKKQGVLKCLVNSHIGQIFIRKILALPLLPAEDIIPAFNWGVENLPNMIKNLLNRFLQYFRRQWLRNVSPEGLSVYKLRIRTNNFSESYNRVLKNRLGIHSNIWCFTSNLQKLQVVSLNEYRALQLGSNIKRNIRLQSLIQNQVIEDAWELYSIRMINIPQFLSCASFFLKAFKSHEIVNETQFIEILRVQQPDGIVSERRIVQRYEDLPVFTEYDLYQLRFLVPEAR